MEKQLRKRLTDLACLLRQLDPCPDPDSEESVPHQELSRDESRQQDLLDAFAFFAATEKSAEHVTAVGMEKIGNTLRFSMAMNGQIPSQIISGLEGLSEAIRNGDSAGEFFSTLIAMC
jgi:hypothetical protein